MDKGGLDVSFEGLIVGFLEKSYIHIKRIHENVDISV